MRRYELMLVLRPDVPEERIQAVLERTTRQVAEAGGQIVKAAPWGRRRLAYQVDRYREGSYHILHFDAPPEAIVDIERTLLITEDVLRHLVVRVERPVRTSRADKGEDGADGELVVAPADEDEPESERIDESESEAAPAATD
jgi:small subunit ribosomal protein S6